MLARTIDPFGNTVQKYIAPFAGVVIGMARNPVAAPGTRLFHLGVPGALEALRGKQEEETE